ncbi:ABC transporter ATP-binding protein/permease [Peribacillus butanolivorans]|uniref:ABC transporter ATP-binding protein n=1 Tax=Peribacillus butanolivorans TaxID=421767 RepID=UPI00207C2EB9|nr:ABC transporter ATP-binding protein [Peribacillus butanolivorans]MCO0597581.1 ABC transporter ATP-binding protein/permease [Peribacillus butanolivorans]
MSGGHIPFSHKGRSVINAKPSKGSIWTMLRQMFNRVPSKWKFSSLIICIMLFISLLEFSIPQLTQYTIDKIIPEKKYDSLIWVGTGILGAAILLALLNYFNSYIVSKVGQKAIMDLRNSMYEHIQRLDMKFFDKNRTGDLMSRLTNDVNLLQQLISSSMLQVVTDTVTFVAVAVYMLFINWKLTIVLLFTFPFMFYITRVFGKRIRMSFRSVQSSAGDISNQLQDSISGMRLIQSFTNEEFESKRFAERNHENMVANIKSVRLRSMFGPVIDLLNNIGLVAVIVFGAWQVMEGAFTVGLIVAFLAYLRLLQSPVRNFSRVISIVQQSAAAFERITEIMETQPEVSDKGNAIELPSIKKQIEFQSVDFAYDEGVPVLSNLNLTMKAGQITALVGSSGAGKSTITNLLIRFYDPQQGTIKMDGLDIRDVSLKSIRSQMGIVSQDIILFNGSIRDNIVYGKLDATDDEITESAKAANAHDFIKAFPNGYDSQIGERGVKLSGGQKQRIAIARALLKNPQIIILDEATSALDTESEHLIQEALSRLLVNRTSIVIAHRLSTVQNADQIIVLEKGSVHEKGTHEQLLTSNGRYRQLHDLQFPQLKAAIT